MSNQKKIIPSKMPTQVLSLLFLVSLLTISCAHPPRSPQPVHQNQTPAWIDKYIEKHYVGQASYALQTIEQAREKALNEAVSSMLSAKAGNTAEVSRNLQDKRSSFLRGSQESIDRSSTIITTVTISGKEIPVQFRVIEYWRDRENGYIYVLIEDLAL